MTRSGVLALLLFSLCAVSAHADLSFIQVVQSQTSHGKQGLFGKTWIELSGRRMRLVSGYAGKVGANGSAALPTRIIQILDLDQKACFILYPETKTYARAPLVDVAYDNRMAKALKSGRPRESMELEDVELQKQPGARVLLGTVCEHYRLSANLDLTTSNGKNVPARMEQDVWVAPVSGPISSALLELIAFENAYRQVSLGSLTPLDYERYQLKEAASYLKISQSSLSRIVQAMRERLRELPSYPVVSSVSWWAADAPKSPERKLRLVTLPNLTPSGQGRSTGRGGRSRRRYAGLPAYAQSSGPGFKVINWHDAEPGINHAYSHARGQLGPSFGFPSIGILPQEPLIYAEFQRRLKEIISLLIKAKNGASASPNPFYEIYAQLYGLQELSSVPALDFALPPGYTEVPYPPVRTK